MAKLKQIGFTIKKDNGVDPAAFDNRIGVFPASEDAIVSFMTHCATSMTYSTWAEATLAGYKVTRIRKEEL